MTYAKWPGDLRNTATESDHPYRKGPGAAVDRGGGGGRGGSRLPTAQVSFPVRSWSRRTIWAFWVGVQRQQTTAGHWQASSMNSYS